VDLDGQKDYAQNLTRDQAHAVATAVSGQCMYISGSAGTGKTVVLKSIYAELVRKGLRVALTATTGAASVNLGGCTIHHAVGAPLAPGAAISQWDLHTLRSIDVLIIDEISMLNLNTLEGIDTAARHARMHNRPFGGLQVIFSGDFLQLCSPDQCCTHEIFKMVTNVVLTTPLRHVNQQKFLSLLQHVRVGQLSSDDGLELVRLQQGLRPGAPLPPGLDDAAVFLFPRRRSAKNINDRRLALVPAEETIIRSVLGEAMSSASLSPGMWLISSKPLEKEDLVQQLNAHSHSEWNLALDDVVIAPMETFQVECLPRLQLTFVRPYAQLCRLMLTPNVSKASPADIASCWEHAAKSLNSDAVPVDAEHGLMLSSKVLMTLEKNGMTLNDSNLTLKVGCRVVVTRNLSGSVINGSLGVVEGFAPPTFSMFPRGVSSCNISNIHITPKLFPMLPIVRISATNETYQIPPVVSIYGGGHSTHYFSQEVYEIPLQLGYAFTVHKVQGLTLNVPVVIDFADYFTCPHLLYVALSRVRDPQNVYLRNVETRHVEVSQVCVDFERRICAAAASLNATSGVQIGSWVQKQLSKAAE
jgi:ATP-dependent DNA helicase PIF1